MRKALLTLAAFAIFFHTMAQSTQKFYLELNSGEKVYTNVSPSLKKNYFYLNNEKKYLNTEIKSFLGSNGYFRRIMNKKQTKADWYRLEQEGKINMLSKESIQNNIISDINSPYIYNTSYTTKAYYFQM